MNDLYNEKNEATYCPEDNKLRLYVGRVPRDEFLKLRAEGWTSTPKQDCDFVTHWRSDREDTCLNYAGYIGDEEQTPEDRAADRAERFAIYRDKRRGEAHDLADDFGSSSPVHGFQSQDKANRAAKKHDRIAQKSVNQWSKAEYWQTRTAGVISSALHKLKPSVRMGRIKILESEERKIIKDNKQYTAERNFMIKIGKIEDPEKNLAMAKKYAELDYWNKDLQALTDTAKTGQEIINKYLETHPDRESFKSRTQQHIELRLGYENSMLQSVGGKCTDFNFEIGGFLGSYQIHKINKSNASKKVISITILGSDNKLFKYNIEKATDLPYKAPKEGDLEKVEAWQKDQKANAPKKMGLINPTLEDAQKLQDLWNEKAKARSSYPKHFEPAEVLKMDQKSCSARSKGSYSPIGTKFIGPDGHPTHKQYSGNTEEGAVFKIRYECHSLNGAYNVIHITDKPGKDLPEFAPIIEAVTA